MEYARYTQQAACLGRFVRLCERCSVFMKRYGAKGYEAKRTDEKARSIGNTQPFYFGLC